MLNVPSSGLTTSVVIRVILGACIRQSFNLSTNTPSNNSVPPFGWSSAHLGALFSAPSTRFQRNSVSLSLSSSSTALWIPQSQYHGFAWSVTEMRVLKFPRIQRVCKILSYWNYLIDLFLENLKARPISPSWGIDRPWELTVAKIWPDCCEGKYVSILSILWMQTDVSNSENCSTNQFLQEIRALEMCLVESLRFDCSLILIFPIFQVPTRRHRPR